MTTTEPKKRGPKTKPAAAHHVLKSYKHAPDVIEILKQIPQGERSRFVDDAIRVLYLQRKRKKNQLA